MNTVLKTAVVAIASSLLVGQNVYSAETYAIDAAHTSIIFGVSHMGYSFTYGRFNKLSGGYVLDRENPTASQFQLTISAASLDTNNPKRDQHLKSPDFFNVKEFPVMTFKSTLIKKIGDHEFEVMGDLSLHGVTQPITAKVRQTGTGKDPRTSKSVIGFETTFTLKRSDFGMKFMIPMISDEVEVIMAIHGVER